MLDWTTTPATTNNVVISIAVHSQTTPAAPRSIPAAAPSAAPGSAPTTCARSIAQARPVTSSATTR